MIIPKIASAVPYIHGGLEAGPNYDPAETPILGDIFSVIVSLLVQILLSIFLSKSSVFALSNMLLTKRSTLHCDYLAMETNSHSTVAYVRQWVETPTPAHLGAQ